MSLKKFLQNLRTVKRCHLPNISPNPKAKIADTIISTILITSTWKPIPASTTTLLSNLTPTLVHLILSDPHIKIPKCLDFFYFLVKNQYLLSFKLNLETHLTLLCRLVKSRKFLDAENLLGSLLTHENVRAGQTETVKTLLEEMQNAGIELAHDKFYTLIDAYCRQQMIDEALFFLVLIQKRGFIADFSIYEMIINGLYESDQPESSQLLLSILVKRGMISEVSNFIRSIESSLSLNGQKPYERLPVST